MKTYLFYSLFFVSSFIVFACDTGAEVDEHYYDRSKQHIKSRGSTVNGQPEGHWEYYDTLGVLQESGNYAKGWREGLWHYNVAGIDTIINWDHIKCESYTINIPGKLKVCKTDKNITQYEGDNWTLKLTYHGVLFDNDSLVKNIFLNDSNSLIEYSRFDIWRVKTTSPANKYYHFRGVSGQNEWVQNTLFEYENKWYEMKMIFPFDRKRIDVYTIIYSNVLITMQRNARVIFDNSGKVKENALVIRRID